MVDMWLRRKSSTTNQKQMKTVSVVYSSFACTKVKIAMVTEEHNMWLGKFPCCLQIQNRWILSNCVKYRNIKKKIKNQWRRKIQAFECWQSRNKISEKTVLKVPGPGSWSGLYPNPNLISYLVVLKRQYYVRLTFFLFFFSFTSCYQNYIWSVAFDALI